MTRKEAIKGLKALSKEFSGYKPNEEMFNMAIEALEKQTPKKPMRVITYKEIDGNFRDVCPSCGWLMFERVTTKDASEPVVCRILNFCQSCGQAIDWGEIMTAREAVNWLINLTADIGKSEHHDLWHYEQALDEIKEMLEGKDTDVPSRKGVFIPDITVEMFRNASLEGVEDLMASGVMEDISLPPAQPDEKLKKCRFEYINACRIVTFLTPDTTKKDISDAYAVIKALQPIFGDVAF